MLFTSVGARADDEGRLHAAGARALAFEDPGATTS